MPLNYWLKPDDDDDDFDYEDEHVEMESDKDEYEEDELEEDLPHKPSQESVIPPTHSEGSHGHEHHTHEKPVEP